MKIFSGSSAGLDCSGRVRSDPAALLADLAQSFDEAIRQGEQEDDPEGSCYIILSHTAAVQIANMLRQIAGRN